MREEDHLCHQILENGPRVHGRGAAHLVCSFKEMVHTRSILRIRLELEADWLVTTSGQEIAKRGR